MNRTPFRIDVPDHVLEDLRRRLALTRWPDSVTDAGWSYGTDLEYLQELALYWQDGFDWRAQEAQLNGFAQYRATIDGFGVHFLFERGRGPDPLPIVLSHGFPDSFTRMLKLIPRLTDPVAHGGQAEDAFDVVVPSLPGFGFSDRPAQPGFGPAQIGSVVAKLMHEELGFTRYAAHGGDWGSVVTEQLALQVPEQLAGVHFTDIPFWRLFTRPPADPSPAEQRFFEAGRRWQRAEGGYFAVQSTKPQTLAFGLNDSPAGLAAWILEKFRSWSDCGGDVEARFTKAELLTNITIYWVTQTIHSACRAYYEGLRAPRDPPGRVEVPAGVAVFPKDLLLPPREYGERFYDIRRWVEMPRGGHFAAMEEPDLLVHELREFFRPLRARGRHPDAREFGA